MKYNAKEMENIIYAYLPKEEGYAKPVLTAMNYAVRAGGKRLRPMMMKLCYDMFVPEGEERMEVIGAFMAAIEMIHTYSLVHDDLPALDNDMLRRGKPTVHAAYGEDMAILAGDALLNYAYETAAGAFRVSPADVRVEKAYAVLASKPGIYGMIGGQVLDVKMSGKPVDEKELAYIYLNKTAALIECAMMAGALLGGASDADTEKLREAACAVGMAFQVQDDILDVTGDESVIGKPVNSDERNQKYTYVTIHGIDASKKYVHDMSERANNILKELVVNNDNAKSALMELIHTLIDRDR